MRAEKNRFATGLRLVITELSMKLSPADWRRLSMVLADAIFEIRRLQDENDGLKEKSKFLSEDRDYWQHKWGNGNG